jgi:hypothetical protein
LLAPALIVGVTLLRRRRKSAPGAATRP